MISIIHIQFSLFIYAQRYQWHSNWHFQCNLRADKLSTTLMVVVKNLLIWSEIRAKLLHLICQCIYHEWLHWRNRDQGYSTRDRYQTDKLLINMRSATTMTFKLHLKGTNVTSTKSGATSRALTAPSVLEVSNLWPKKHCLPLWLTPDSQYRWIR